MKIYTKTGDRGTTVIASGEKVPKYDLRLEAYGTVDELIAIIGVSLAFVEPNRDAEVRDDLVVIQRHLMNMAGQLSFLGGKKRSPVSSVSDTDVKWLEQRIDRMQKKLPELRSFILPQGCKLAGFLHVCRTVCRRAERRVSQLTQKYPLAAAEMVYLNRLSDWFFTAARYVNLQRRIEEETL